MPEHYNDCLVDKIVTEFDVILFAYLYFQNFL